MEFVFPLKQNVGAPAQPVVETGASVKRGQLLAVPPEGALGSRLFSSVDGVISAIGPEQIVIEEHGTDFSGYLPLKGSSPAELIRESGLVGLGGAGFPTYAKLDVDFMGEGTVIVNAAECEPVLAHNIARIQKEPGKLLEGLQIVMELVHASRGIVAMKAIHQEAVRALNSCITDSRISVLPLENRYPTGEERALIREALGVLLGPHQLPKEAGAVVINAETVCRLREAVIDRKPLIDKDLTVAGKLSENASIHVLPDVPVGMKVADVLKKAGGVGNSYGELIMGGPFTGRRTSPEAPVVKTTGGILAAEEFLSAPGKIGLLVCACGADEKRLREQAASMGAEVAGVEFCKQARRIGSGLKCENPGRCPGQVQKVLSLKKAGAAALLISSCTDCSNTVMSCAPRLGLPVYHCTDGALRAVNHKLIRKIHSPAAG